MKESVGVLDFLDFEDGNYFVMPHEYTDDTHREPQIISENSAVRILPENPFSVFETDHNYFSPFPNLNVHNSAKSGSPAEVVNEVQLPEDTNACILSEELTLPEETNPCILPNLSLGNVDISEFDDVFVLPEFIPNSPLVFPGEYVNDITLDNSQVSCLQTITHSNENSTVKDNCSEMLLDIDTVLDSSRVMDTVEGFDVISELCDTLENDTLSILRGEPDSDNPDNVFNTPENDVDINLFSPSISVIETVPLRKNGSRESLTNTNESEASEFVELTRECTNISETHVKESECHYDTDSFEIVKESIHPIFEAHKNYEDKQKLMLIKRSYNSSVFTCPVCDKPIMRRHNFYKHCRKKHGMIPVITGHLSCPYDNCVYQCKDYTILRIHLDMEHSVICEEEVWQFSSFEDFGRWKKHMQEIEHNSYVTNTSPVTLSTGDKRFYYKCSASQRRSRKADKIPQVSCPSTVDATVHFNGVVYVSKWTTHLGHDKTHFNKEKGKLKTKLNNENKYKRKVSKKFKNHITVEGKLKAEMTFEATGLENPLSCLVNYGPRKTEIDAEDLKWKSQMLTEFLTKTEFSAEIGKEVNNCLSKCLEVCFNEQKAIGDYIDSEQDLTEILQSNLDCINDLSVNGLNSKDINILEALLIHRGFDHTYV